MFDPDMRLKDARPIPKEKPKEGFLVGDKFEIVSSGDRLEIIKTGSGLKLHYLNVGKENISVPVAQLEKSLSFGSWKRV